ncbi:hypothetical protein E4T56_gene13038, partial [Termitomyces sp. T112]
SSHLHLVSTVHISFVLPSSSCSLPQYKLCTCATTQTFLQQLRPSLPAQPQDPSSPGNPLSSSDPAPITREASAYPAIYLRAHELALTPALGQRPVPLGPPCKLSPPPLQLQMPGYKRRTSRPPKLSAAVAGPWGPTSGEVPAQSAGEMVLASCSRSGMVPRVVCPVPMGSRVTQADVMLEYFAEAAGRARGPPMLEWCQVVAPCTSCTRWGEQCEFEEPMPGVRWDTSVCLPCHLRHEKCSVTLSWHATCIMAEQGWDCKWVATQLEEGWRGRVSGRGSGVEGGVGTGQPLMKIGPLQGGQREGAPTTRNKGKQRASPLLEAGPSKQAQGELAMVGPPGPTVYSSTSGALVEQSAGGLWLIAKAFLQHQAEELERLLATCGEEVCRVGEERDGFRRELDKAWKEQDLVHRDKDITVGTAMEQLSQLQELRACMRLLEAWVEVAGQ